MTAHRTVVLALLAAVAAAEDVDPSPTPAPGSDAAREIVVTPDRRPMPLERTTATVVVADSADLSDRGHPAFVGDALRDHEGVEVQGLYGGVGGITRIRIRGAQGPDTALLVDGIPISDPGDFDQTPDLAWLNPAGIERIELVKGAQSGLYGSRAVGGVVNVITARPTAEPHGYGRVEYGSRDTRRVDLGATGPIAGSAGYALGASGLASQGMSSLTDPDAHGDDRGHEPDPFRRAAVNARVEAGDERRLRGYVAGAFSRGEREFDEFDPVAFPLVPLPDDRSAIEELRSWRAATGASLRVREDVVFAADAAVSDYDRGYPNAVFESRSIDTREWYASGRATYELAQRAAFTLGIDGRRDEAQVSDPVGVTVVDARDRLIGGWAQAVYTAPEAWDVSAVLRHDDHSREGDATTGRLGAGWTIRERVRLIGSVATGFRAPSLQQLYAPFFGNPDLEAERSRGYEAGARIALGDGLRFDSTWFRTDYIRKFDFAPAPSFRTTTVPGARIDGIENALVYEVRRIEARLHYTWLRSDDGNNDPLYDTPRDRAGLAATWRPGRTWWRAAVDWVGRRDMPDLGGARTTLDAYTVVSASAGWTPRPWLELYARGENIANEHYETNIAYTTPGPSAYVGVTARY